MSDREELDRLVEIIERLEIAARQRDSKLLHARQIITRLQTRVEQGTREETRRANEPDRED